MIWSSDNVDHTHTLDNVPLLVSSVVGTGEGVIGDDGVEFWWLALLPPKQQKNELRKPRPRGFFTLGVANVPETTNSDVIMSLWHCLNKHYIDANKTAPNNGGISGLLSSTTN